jgi:hypothetical protein
VWDRWNAESRPLHVRDAKGAREDMMDKDTAALVLIGALRLIAHDPTLTSDDALRRIRDEFYDYDRLRTS